MILQNDDNSQTNQLLVQIERLRELVAYLLRTNEELRSRLKRLQEIHEPESRVHSDEDVPA